MYHLKQSQNTSRPEMTSSESSRVDAWAAVAIASHVDPSICACIEPVEDLADTEEAAAITALSDIVNDASVVFLLIRSKQHIDEFDETNHSQDEGTLTNRTDMLSSISLRSFTIGMLSLEVPTCSCAAHQEVAGMNEKEHSPEQVE